MSGLVPPRNIACAPASVSKISFKEEPKISRRRSFYFLFFLVEARYAPLDFAEPPPRETCAPKEGKWPG